VPRYEFVEGTSSKFWEITLSGSSFTTTYGRIGTDGSVTLKEYDSPEQAKKEYDKLIAAKVKKGYQLVGDGGGKPKATKAKAEAEAPKAKKASKKAEAPAEASKGGGRRYEFSEGSSNKFWEVKIEGANVITIYGRIGSDGQTTLKEYDNPAQAKKEYDKLIASKEKKGYQLVSEGSAGAAPVAKQARNPELEAQILSNPDDAEPYLVYADWLQAQGDPRGELITVQHQLADKPKDKALKKAEADLLKAYGDSFLPARVAEMLGQKKDNSRGGDGRCEVVWRNGFIHSARIGRESEDDDPHTVEELLADLLGHASAKFLQGLTIGALGVYDEYDFGGVVKTLVKAKPRTVRSLFLAEFNYEYTELSWSHLGDVSKLCETMPDLENLTLRAGSMKLGAINLPKLRALKVVTGGLDKKNLQAICAAKWPALASLHVYLGTDNYGGNCKLKDAAPLLEGANLPKLRHLGLMNSEFTDEICRALPGSKILPRLESLDLSLGTMSDGGATALSENKQAFKHLKSINFSENFLTKKGIALVKGLCPDVQAAKQKEPYDWAEDEDGGRYVSVGE
jgi:uncharacterized protein (TIGR02996 family)